MREKSESKDMKKKKDYVRGKPIKKGQVLNPKGRPKLAPEVKELRKLNLDSYCNLVDKYINASKEEIKAAVTNPNTSALELFIAKIIEKGVNAGDTQRLGFLLDRLIGPVRQKIEHSGAIGTVTTDLSKLTDKELEQLEKLQKKIQVEDDE